jgi:hypothetical protein
VSLSLAIRFPVQAQLHVSVQRAPHNPRGFQPSTSKDKLDKLDLSQPWLPVSCPASHDLSLRSKMYIIPEAAGPARLTRMQQTSVHRKLPKRRISRGLKRGFGLANKASGVTARTGVSLRKTLLHPMHRPFHGFHKGPQRRKRQGPGRPLTEQLYLKPSFFCC